jgi:hypothetical protein
VSTLRAKATIHGEVRTLETTLLFGKANIPLYVGKADERTPCLHSSIKIRESLGH